VFIDLVGAWSHIVKNKIFVREVKSNQPDRRMFDSWFRNGFSTLICSF
jgi:hypothetical protein